MSRPCNKRATTGLDICTLAPHDNKTPHKDESTGRTWGGKRKPNPLIKRTGIKAVSDKQEVRQAYIEGRKDERIHQMIERSGYASCECLYALGVSEHCNRWRNPDAAKKVLDFAHITKRSQAQGYRPGKGGQNDAHFYLLCRRHHEEFDGSVVRPGERAS